MHKPHLLLILSLITISLASILPTETLSFQQYLKNLDIQTHNYLGCSVWKSTICQKYSEWFELNEDQQCILKTKYAQAGCKYFLKIGACLECEENWVIRTVIFQNMKNSSIYCIPERKWVKFEEEKGCEKCREGYEEKDGECSKEEQEIMMTDLGCIMMEEGKCKMCWPAYKKNMEGRCVKM